MQGEAAGQTVNTVPWSKYTHVIHFAIKPTYSNGVCGWDTSYGITGSNITNFVSAAHAAGVKAILGVLQDDSVAAMRTCTDSAHIGQFVNSISDFVSRNGYDGVDIDWESNIIASQYQDLMRRLRSAMPSATITVAVTVTERYITAAVQDQIDQINLMAYDLDFSDLSGATVNYTWYNAPTMQGSNTGSNAADILAWYFVTDAGNASNKIGIGVPFYGRIKRGCRDSSGASGVTDPNQTWVSGGSRDAILYRDLVNSSYWNSGTRVWDDERKSQYVRYRGGSCSSDAFIPFTGPEQVKAVVDMVKARNLGGVMTYGLPYEYIAGETGDARYPLSTAMHSAMGGTVSGGSGGSTSTAPSITTTSLPAGTVGTPYSAALSATGTGPISWSITAGALPAGLSLNSGSGAVSGTPASAGTSTFTATASSSAGTDSKSVTLTINPAGSGTLAITTSSLPSATVGSAYSFTLATNSSSAVKWSLPGGSLPPGTYLAADTGEISGTPSSAGSWSFTVGASDGSSSVSKAFTLTVGAAASTALSITTGSPLPSAAVGTAYSVMLTTNSSTAVKWSLPGGSLPPGIYLAADTGEISGTPSTAGTWTFTVGASNGSGSTTRTFSMTVAAPAATALAITTDSLPAGTVGAAYSFRLSTNSSTAVKWSLPGGSLPPGLYLAADTGDITGTPTTQGSWTFTVGASNGTGSTSKTFTLSIAGAATTALAITTGSPLPSGTVGVNYSVVLATNSTSAVKWSLPGGSLPPGLYLAADTGAIAGTPTTAGTWTFTVGASNGTGSTSKTFTLSVAAPVSTALAITTGSPLPSGTVGVGYSLILATNSTGAVKWSLPGGSLPPGLYLGADTGAITGTPTTAGTWSFTVGASDGTTSTSKAFSLTVGGVTSGTLAITTSSLPKGHLGSPYYVKLETNSATAVTWSLPGGSLPSGLYLAAGTGEITGTPSATGNWTFTAGASNGTGTATKTYRIGIRR